MGKKEQILETMLEVVNEGGLIGTTIAKISKKANISPGIIYHYFETKDEIIHTLFDNLETEFMAKLNIPALLSLPLLECYKHLWINVFYFCIENPDKMSFIEAYKTSPYIDKSKSKFRTDFLQKLKLKNATSIKSGEMKDLTIEAVYAMTGKVSQELAKLQIRGVCSFCRTEVENLAEAVCSSIFHSGKGEQ